MFKLGSYGRGGRRLRCGLFWLFMSSSVSLFAYLLIIWSGVWIKTSGWIGSPLLILGLLLLLTPLYRPLVLTHDSLYVPRYLFFRELSIPVSSITVVEIGRYKWGGLAGYNGWALAIEANGRHMLVGQSLHCGYERLARWVGMLRGCDGFEASIVVNPKSRFWEGPMRWPSA